MAQEIRPELDKIDRVKQVLDKGTYKVDFNLPIIVVIGDQSSGKSSVLESISRISLPKGEGMVTRCPLVMQLRNTVEAECAQIWSSDESQDQAAAVDLANIAQTIDAKQREMTSMGGRISKEPIYLRIYKQNFFDLTLVDLPGLTYVDGLGRFIANIYEDYIANPNSIILYVTSATTDLVTGQSIELIDTHDKDWQRTMTIVTKVDARDSSFYQKFKVVDRGLGGFCVRNRTTDEIHQGVSHAEILQKERVLLSDPDFEEIPAE